MTIEQILAKSAHMHKLKTDSGFLFAELQNVSTEVLNEWEQVWAPKGDFWPVITLRYLVLKKLKNKEVVNQKTIEEIKAALSNRDISAYGEFSHEFLESLKNYPHSEKKGMFPQWQEPFKVLYQFFYTNKEKEELKDLLIDLGNQIITRNQIENAKVHVVGFDGPQNYGDSRSWAVVIPKEAAGPRSAYQIYYGFFEGKLEGGLVKGHSLNNPAFVDQINTYENWEDFLSDINNFSQRWEQLNSQLDFTFSKDESKLKKLLAKIKTENRDIYFALMDELVNELNIPNEKNLVFSIALPGLSFQVGRRYCLNLKKNQFSFIAPPNYVLEGFEKEEFTHGHNAFLYHGADGQEIINHYPAMARAIHHEIERDVNASDYHYDNAAFRQAVFDKEYRGSLFTPVTDINIQKTHKEKEMPDECKLNLIMFGPPGTGKTYHTVGEAIKIVDKEFYKENEDFTHRKALRQKYQDLLIIDWEATTGQIGFCTFHQSFSYEDFVEGIRPMEPQEGDTYLKYEVVEGIFKRICRLAEDNLKSLSQKAKHLISIPANEYANASFYKISLGDINDPADQDIYDYCVDNGVISIGFGDGIDFSSKDESEVNEAYTAKYRDNGYGAQAINFFKNYLKVGNYVVVSKGNFYVRAIGKVTGEYFYDPKTAIRHKHFRKVDWLFKDQEIPIQDIYEKNLSQQTIYKLKSDWIKREFFVKSTESAISENNNEPKKFVLIIDEINRGNVASIFGELITLIERDKRAGKEEATVVVLPYSKEKFSVPENLYIIGTMNTAERSIEALDTALRRRFSFREMPPKPELIKTEGALKEAQGKIGELDVVKLLETINKRLEKLIDKDHRIGHSYFMQIKTEAELKLAFKDRVIPLLEEYFFGDFGKIGLVLGSSFIEKIKENTVFASFDYGDAKQDLEDRPVYKIKDQSEWDFASIYQKP